MNGSALKGVQTAGKAIPYVVVAVVQCGVGATLVKERAGGGEGCARRGEEE